MAGCAAERTAPRDWGSAWMILVGMWNPLSSIMNMSNSQVGFIYLRLMEAV